MYALIAVVLICCVAYADSSTSEFTRGAAAMLIAVAAVELVSLVWARWKIELARRRASRWVDEIKQLVETKLQQKQPWSASEATWPRAEPCTCDQCRLIRSQQRPPLRVFNGADLSPMEGEAGR